MFDLSRGGGGVEVLNEGKLQIEERTCRKTRLGGGDYSLRTSALPPSSRLVSVCLFPINVKTAEPISPFFVR